MSCNIQERQRNGLIQMLSLNDMKPPGSSYTSYASSSSDHEMLWKVLIYDKPCQDLIGPLMKVWSLRQHGVTLHLPLASERTPVHEAPAVYLVEPTPENVDIVLKDLQSALYRRYFINFSGSIPKPLLEKFAKSSAENNTTHLVGHVVDRFLQFVSLSSSEFCLDTPGVFTTLHSTNDTEIERLLVSLVDGLLNVVITLGVIPVIRCPTSPSSPAHLIGRRLFDKLKELLAQRGQQRSTQLLAIGQLMVSTVERPALIIVDRDIDFSVVLRHTWTYQALVHDLFGLRRNRVTIPISSSSSGTASVSTQKKTYDLDSTDVLWSEFGPKAFPEAAVAISDALNDYNARMSQMGQQRGESKNTSDDLASGMSQSLATAINALPEMTEKKRGIDLHTNLATAVVAEITARGLDKLFEAEDSFESASFASSVPQLEKLLEPDEKGTGADKERTLLCYYLMKPQLPHQQLSKLRGILNKQNVPTRAIDCLQQLGSFKALQQTQMGSSQSGASSAASSNSSALWGINWIDRSKGLLEGVRSLLPLKRTLPLTRLVEQLLEMKPQATDQAVQQQYLYLDPKASVQLGVADDKAPKLKSSFKQSIVFVVGGGTFVESHALKEFAAKGGKQIFYGSTDFVSPEEFLNELETLGQF